MNKTILIFTILLGIITVKAQSNFSNGYQKGFKEGYFYQSKQNGNVGCIEPIPPISPLSEISRGEDESSFQDGYHRGFEDGKLNFLLKNSNSTNPLYTPRKYPEVYEPDMMALMGIIAQQRKWDKIYYNRAKEIDQYYNDLQINFLKKNQKLLEQAITYYKQIDSLKLDTLKLKDGWHEVVMIYDNKYDFLKSPIKEVNIAKGFIQNGKLQRLYRNNYYGNKSKIPQAYSQKMTFKRGYINLSHTYPNGFSQEITLLPLTQYIKPSYSGIPPLKPAKVVLWTKKKRYAGTIVEIDEIEENGWINNIVKTEVVYSKNPPTECNCNLKPGLVVLKSNKISPTRFIEDNNLSLYYKGYRFYNTIKVSENQCLAIEYK